MSKVYLFRYKRYKLDPNEHYHTLGYKLYLLYLKRYTLEHLSEKVRHFMFLVGSARLRLGLGSVRLGLAALRATHATRATRATRRLGSALARLGFGEAWLGRQKDFGNNLKEVVMKKIDQMRPYHVKNQL